MPERGSAVGRELRECVTALTEGPDMHPGPWHAEESGDRAAYGWWLENAEGDCSFPSPDDVALMLTVLADPRTLLAAALAKDEGTAALAEALIHPVGTASYFTDPEQAARAVRAIAAALEAKP